MAKACHERLTELLILAQALCPPYHGPPSFNILHGSILLLQQNHTPGGISLPGLKPKLSSLLMCTSECINDKAPDAYTDLHFRPIVVSLSAVALPIYPCAVHIPPVPCAVTLPLIGKSNLPCPWCSRPHREHSSESASSSWNSSLLGRGQLTTFFNCPSLPTHHHNR